MQPVSQKNNFIYLIFSLLILLLVGALVDQFPSTLGQHILGTLNSSGLLDQETLAVVNELFFDFLLLIGVGEFLILLLVGLVSLSYVFKVTGAEYALARHVREKLSNGQWEPLHLRKGDALVSVADELNKLSEKQAGSNPDAS